MTDEAGWEVLQGLVSRALDMYRADLRAKVEGLHFKGEESAWNNALDAVLDLIDGNSDA